MGFEHLWGALIIYQEKGDLLTIQAITSWALNTVNPAPNTRTAPPRLVTQSVRRTDSRVFPDTRLTSKLSLSSHCDRLDIRFQIV
jgi:hypothetical protein